MPRLSVLLMALGSISGSTSIMASCGPWMPQTNGTYWRMCVDQQNQQYCEARSGQAIQRITCP